MSESCFRIKNLIGNKWFILLFNTAFFALMAWLLPIHFEQNDDVVMCLIANGRYTGHPDGHLVFINALYGWAIALLYNLNGNIEWYSLAFGVFHILAVTIIVLHIVAVKWKEYSKWIVVLFLYVFWARIIVAFQFTTTAGLLCCAGCLALLNSNRKWRITGILCVLLASMIRFHAAALVGLLFAPLFFAEFLEVRHFAYWMIITLVLVCIIKLCDSLLYRNHDWIAYKEYNAVRSAIQDSPSCNKATLKLPDGVHDEDYQLFLRFIGDPSVMTTERLTLLRRELVMADGQSFINNIKNKEGWSFLNRLIEYRVQLALFFVGFVLVLFRLRKTWRKYLVLSELLLIVVIVLFLSFVHIIPYRVFNCLVLPIVLFLVCCDSYSFSSVSLLPSKLEKSLFVVVIVLLTAKYLKHDIVMAKQWPELVGRFEKQTSIIHEASLRYDGFRIFPYSGPEFLDIPPFKVSSYPFRFVFLGWITNCPLNNGVLNNHFDFVDSNILLFSHQNTPPMDILSGIERNYGVKCRVEIVGENDEYVLYKIMAQ